MIRTLLVDNYDSFTYNLFHALAQVNGCAPTVVTNDWRGWRPEVLAEFDNVVLSAGPGSPSVRTDFGICSSIIACSPIPLLGICLGHQGVAHAYGARIVRAPEPLHGRMRPVTHDGTGLFDGIPSPFQAVCYHSLAVAGPPESLLVTATASAGEVMALRHKHRPQWGVQFHPESVCTAHGTRLLANFAELTRQWQRDHDAPRPTVRPRATVGAAARTAAGSTERRRAARIESRSIPLRCDEERLFDAICGTSRYAVWLDGNQDGNTLARFSIMGGTGGPRARVVTADVATQTVTLRRGADQVVEQSGFFDWLEKELAAHPVDASDLPFDFALGWVGYLGYELKAECGAVGTHRSDLPDAAMVYLDRALVVDHQQAVVHLLALRETDDDEARIRQWFEQSIESIEALAPDPVENVTPPTGLTLTARHSREAYAALIARAQSLIADGETYESCLTNMVHARGSLDPWDAYRLLRRENPAPFGAFLQIGEVCVLSTSPERFLRVSAEGEVEARPIKGTRPRGATPKQDDAIARELAGCEKDRAENLMIVDLVRHDLGRTAEIGSVTVPQLFDVERFATVHQLVSTVRSRLAEGHSPVEAVRAAFPPGSMTGAPKLRTMSILEELESGPRGVYSGALGYFSLSGAVDLSVVIRSLVVQPASVSYGVGGAIVALSDPAAEYAETVVKAEPLLRLLNGAEFPGSQHEAGSPGAAHEGGGG